MPHIFYISRNLGLVSLATLVLMSGCESGAGLLDPTDPTGFRGTSITPPPEPVPAVIAAPEFSVREGTYPTSQSVLITSASGDAELHYTLDHSNPTCDSSPIYSGPIRLTFTRTIKAVACSEDGSSSRVSTSKYTILPSSDAPKIQLGIDSGFLNTRFQMTSVFKVAALDFYLDSKLIGSGVYDPDFDEWNPPYIPYSKLSNGPHELLAVATDEAENVGTGFLSIDINFYNKRPFHLELGSEDHATAVLGGRMSLSVNFANVDWAESHEESIRVVNQSSEAVKFISLKAPRSFGFKGGVFPGVGGTCANPIPAQSICYLSMSFSPKRAEFTHSFQRDPLQFSHDSDGRIAEFTFNNGSDFLDKVGLSANVNQGFGAAQVGTSLTRDFSISFSPGAVVENVGISPEIYRVSSPNQIVQESLGGASTSFSSIPFTLLGGTCLTTQVLSGQFCNFKFNFRASDSNIHRVQYRVTYKENGIQKSKPMTVIGEGLAPDPSQNLLVIYNQKSQQSIDLKNYYLTRRPGIASANLLAVNFPSDCSITPCPNANVNAETTSIEVFDRDILKSYLEWRLSHPTKAIRAIVVMYGVPSRTYYTMATGALSSGISGAKLISDAVDRCTAFESGSTRYEMGAASKELCSKLVSINSGPNSGAQPTYLYMGPSALGDPLEPTKAYIDKLARISAKMTSSSVLISAKATGRTTGTYYIEDAGGYSSAHNGRDARDAILASAATASVDFHDHGQPYITTAQDVIGFLTWGHNGGRQARFNSDGSKIPDSGYANDGRIKFSGNSDWYLIQTIESFDGQRLTWQGNFIDWFAANAFGGSAYSNTSVAAVTHVEEPGLEGVHNSEYFPCWESGRSFLECAWSSVRTQATMPVGDPWVRK